MRAQLNYLVTTSIGTTIQIAGEATVTVKNLDSTNAVLYAGPEGSTQITNPLVADSSGRVSAWLELGKYLLIVTGAGAEPFSEYWDAVPGDQFTTLGKGSITHGSTSSVPRPRGFASVEWIGSVAPANAASQDTWINTLGGLTADTADTFESYKIILLAESNSVKAIPVTAVAPAQPTGVTVNARLSSIRVAWSPAARATAYRIFRDGSLKATISGRTSYRDLAFTPNVTYSYQVQSVDGYGQRSAKSVAVTGNASSASNVAPVSNVTSWPPTYPTNGRTYLRLNASDVDAQVLAMGLSLSGSGSIAPTDDPSVWIYTP